MKEYQHCNICDGTLFYVYQNNSIGTNEECAKCGSWEGIYFKERKQR